ncbi:hypothetical protein KR222_010575 [Zaprionus bogoriensis]|nr:hypothetical protein KR222_010575 [Zaprionus bogoriensis]
MSSTRNKLYALLGYILAAHGLTKFHFNLQAGKWQKSRFLHYYAIMQNVILLCAMSWMVNEERNHKRKHYFPTNFVRFVRFIRCIEISLTTLNCVYSSQFQQQRVTQLYEKLRRIQRALQSHNRAHNEKRSERVFLCLNLFSIVVNFILLEILDYGSVRSIKFISFIYWELILFGNLVAALTYVVAFYIIWSIYQCCDHLRNCLADRQYDLHNLHHQQQQLIDLTTETCRVFNNILTYFPVRAGWFTILSGYFLIRHFYGTEEIFNMAFKQPVIVIMAFSMITNLMVLYGFSCLAGKMSRILKETGNTLRESQTESVHIERKNDWLAMHLSWQSMELRLFGAVTLSGRLFFCFMSQILLYTICLVQGDFHNIWY